MEVGFAYNPAKGRQTKTKVKSKSQIIPHPIFAKLIIHTEDEYWQHFFTRLSLNKFPFGFSFYAGSLFYKKGTKPPKLLVTESDEETANNVIKFFGMHGSYFSSNDKKEKEDENKTPDSPENELYEWKKLKKSEKTLYIENYIRKMAEEWDLEDEEKDEFSEIIFEGIDSGQIKGNRINLSKDQIESISEVDFDEDKRTFEIKLTAKRISKPSTKQKADPLTKKWTEALIKKIKNTAPIKQRAK
jgi:hypothetical protein